MSKGGAIKHFEIPEMDVEFITMFSNVSACQGSIVSCAGGWPVHSGYVCTHCGSDEPDTRCEKPGAPYYQREGIGESFFSMAELRDFEVRNNWEVKRALTTLVRARNRKEV